MITINKQKIEELKNQYRQALDNINTEEDLKSLLDTAIKFNKYPFDNIVLIHNQNPDAEFLATIDVWNNQVGRYVNRGTKGLAVLEIENPKPTFKYLFELKNTNGSYASYKKVLDYKWEIKEEDTSQIVKNLNKKNGTNYENIREYLRVKELQDNDKSEEMLEEIFEKTTKTQTSDRIIYLSNKTIEILKAYQKEQLENKLKLGSKWANSKRIFTTIVGGDMHPDTPSQILEKIIKKYDLKRISFHGLRHTSISLQISSGIQAQIISKRAGHSSVSTTHSIYSHFFDNEFKEVASAMNNILSVNS